MDADFNHPATYPSLNPRLHIPHTRHIPSYAVRGPVLDLAMQLDKKLKEGKEPLPFDELIYCNIGAAWVKITPTHVHMHVYIDVHSDATDTPLTSSFPHPPIHPSTRRNAPTGNPQSLTQAPMTYIRQVLALVVNPALLDQHAHLVRGFVVVVVVVVVVGMRCMHLSSCSALCKSNGESVLIQTQPPPFNNRNPTHN